MEHNAEVIDNAAHELHKPRGAAMRQADNDYPLRVVYAAKEIHQDHEHRMGRVHSSRKSDWDSLTDALKTEYLRVASLVDGAWVGNPGTHQRENTLSEVVAHYMTRFAYTERERTAVTRNARFYVRGYEKGYGKWDKNRGN